MSEHMTVARRSFGRIAKPLVVGLLASPLALRTKLRMIGATESLTILCLHRVADETNNRFEALPPALFDDLLGWLAPRFNIVTFAELAQREKDSRPPLVLSFDDGYADFYDITAPILRRHGLKANQNIIPGCIESGLPPINVVIQDFLLSAPGKLLSEIAFPGLSAGFPPADRASLALRVSATLKAKPIAEQRSILAELKPQFERFDNFRTTPMMTRAQVVELAGIHEVGVHSWEHASMSVESAGYLLDDTRRCKQYLADLGIAGPLVYAFPNGMLREEQVDAVHAAGFDHVLGVGENFSRPHSALHQRFTIYGHTVAETRFRALGGLRHPSRF